MGGEDFMPVLHGRTQFNILRKHSGHQPGCPVARGGGGTWNNAGPLLADLLLLFITPQLSSGAQIRL